MSKKLIVLLAEGFEEVEAVTPIDYLRRAGFEVTVAAIGKELLVCGAHGLKLSADTFLAAVLKEGKAWDGVVIPGGLPGADNLAASEEVGALIKELNQAGKLVAAICASPAWVLSPLGILAGKKFCCYPGAEQKVLSPASASPGAKWIEDKVVVDGNIITSRGPGTAGEFALAIVAKLAGEEEAKKQRKQLLL